MSGYTELCKQVLDAMPVKRAFWGRIEAVKAATADQFELAKEMWTAGQGTFCREYPWVTIQGAFSGADWYSLEETCIDAGMDGCWSEYKIESLTEKKEKFAQYCAGFEEAEDDD